MFRNISWNAAEMEGKDRKKLKNAVNRAYSVPGMALNKSDSFRLPHDSHSLPPSAKVIAVL